MDAVDIEKSKHPSCIIASIPHGSSKITSDMRRCMRENVLLTNNDWFLNELYNFLPKLNITKISANYSRYVIDVNRNINKEKVRGDYTESLVYHKTTFRKEIYKKALSSETIKNRIVKFYDPYHFHLLDEINKSLKLNKKAYLLDLHSFYAQSEADVVLGTWHGDTCSSKFLNIVYNAFVSEKFIVKFDEAGLKGGFITTHYSTIKNVEAIQIELRYTSYIEERNFEEEVTSINKKMFYETQERLKRVFKKIIRELE